MKLSVLNNKLPLKAYPEKDLDLILNTKFKFWLSNLLSIKAENEDKVDLAIPIIKRKFKSLGFEEVSKAFEMYALGELSIKPISNHFDLILVGQVFNCYKEATRTKDIKTYDYDKEKEDQDYLDCINAFDAFVQGFSIEEKSVWLYDYLEDYKKALSVDVSDKKTRFNIAFDKYNNKEKAIIESKIKITEHFFAKIHAKGKHIKDFI